MLHIEISVKTVFAEPLQYQRTHWQIAIAASRSFVIVQSMSNVFFGETRNPVIPNAVATASMETQ
jgi:hypothetical protein